MYRSQLKLHIEKTAADCRCNPLLVFYCLILELGLLPVTCVVVRGFYATYFQTSIVVEFLFFVGQVH